MNELIVTCIEQSIYKIQINRPEKKNALTTQMYAAVADALAEAEANTAVRVIYITGTSDSFTAGNDLMDFVQNPPTDERSPVSRFLRGIAGMSKPMVAAVNGLAIGVGTTMLLHCDLVYAAESARFQLPFVNLALVPEAASSYIMPRMMGRQRAAELLLLGEMFSAQKAYEYGIVNGVVADDRLQDVAWQKALALSRKAPEALRLTKMLLRKGETREITAVMQEESDHFTNRLGSPEAQEVMSAFLEKRQPDFSKLR